MSGATPNAFTVLSLSSIGVAPYATRGATMTMAHIAQAGPIVRNVNGGLIDLSDPNFRKYRGTITCADQKAPAFGGLWPGQLVTVDCIAELGEGELNSDRTAVTGSEYTEEGITYFRPSLNMMVMSFEWETDEYGARVGWTMQVEEV